MRPTLCLTAAALAVGLVACGGGSEPTAPPPKPPVPASAPAKAPANPVVLCIAKWTAGPKAPFTCTVLGQPQGTVTKINFRLDKFCVNDPRLTKFTYEGSQVETLSVTGEPRGFCQSYEALARLPETCLCEPQGGQTCDQPPKDGFSCVAIGHLVVAP